MHAQNTLQHFQGASALKTFHFFKGVPVFDEGGGAVPWHNGQPLQARVSANVSPASTIQCYWLTTYYQCKSVCLTLSKPHFFSDCLIMTHSHVTSKLSIETSTNWMTSAAVIQPLNEWWVVHTDRDCGSDTTTQWMMSCTYRQRLRQWSGHDVREFEQRLGTLGHWKQHTHTMPLSRHTPVMFSCT